MGEGFVGEGQSVCFRVNRKNVFRPFFALVFRSDRFSVSCNPVFLFLIRKFFCEGTTGGGAAKRWSRSKTFCRMDEQISVSKLLRPDDCHCDGQLVLEKISQRKSYFYFCLRTFSKLNCGESC